MFSKNDIEPRCVAAVAQTRGGKARLPSDSEHKSGFPDGWIDEENGPAIPVEVVSAFPGETRVDQTAWARAQKCSAQRARLETQRTGEPSSWIVENGRADVAKANYEIPVTTQPFDAIVGISRAIEEKANHYDNDTARKTILVVHQVDMPLPLQEVDLGRIRHHATGISAPFLEIWIVNDYDDPAQKVP